MEVGSSEFCSEEVLLSGVASYLSSYFLSIYPGILQGIKTYFSYVK